MGLFLEDIRHGSFLAISSAKSAPTLARPPREGVA